MLAQEFAILNTYLHNKPVTVMFIAIFIGFAISRIKIRGFSIGTAGVLIAGMILGSIGITIPNVIRYLGLLLFMYAVGVQAGPRVFSIFAKNNIRYFWVSATIFSVATMIAFLFSKIMGLHKDMFVGIYTGMFSSPSALANIFTTNYSTDAILGYTFAYPVSLILSLTFVNIIISRYHLESNPHLDGHFKKDIRMKDEKIINEQILVKTDNECEDMSIPAAEDKYGIVITGIVRGNEVTVPDEETVLKPGDVLTAEGYESDVKTFEKAMGEITHDSSYIPWDVETRHILVTNRQVDGMTIKDLKVRSKYHCVITKIWRSGVTIAVTSASIPLEIGDTLVVVGAGEHIKSFTDLMGKQKATGGEVDFLSMSLVIILGVLLGNLSVNTPGGGSLKLGVAGGVLLVALILGYVRRIGFVYGQMTPSARTLLREMGLIFFMMGVGTEAGRVLGGYSQSDLIRVFFSSLAVQLGFLLLIFLLIVAYRGRRRAASILSIFCGSITNTPAVGLVVEKTGSEEFMIPFASVYPVATVLILVLSQILYLIY